MAIVKRVRTPILTWYVLLKIRIAFGMLHGWRVLTGRRLDFGTTNVHVVVDSVFKDGVRTHTFENTADWLDEVFWARIYVGFHFHHSLQDGVELGRLVSRQLFENNFQVVHHDRHEMQPHPAD